MSRRKIIPLLVVFLAGGLFVGLAVIRYRVGRKDAFLDAVEGGDFETVQELLTKEPSFVSLRDGKGKGGIGSPVLHAAICCGYADIAELLLSKGANPNEKGIGRQTPLHKAALKGDAELVELLVKYGANVNAPEDRFYHTPLCFARSRKAAEALIAKGADLAWRDKYGGTALHSVARLGATEAAEVLIEHGVGINAKDKAGSTPLHRATVHGRKKMVELLIAKGANIEAKDKRGFSPLRRAMERAGVWKVRAKDVAELLISHGAKYTINDVALLGDLAKVRRMLEDDPTLVNNVSVPSREPVLLAAICGGHRDVVELFLEKGAKFDVRKTYEEPALHVSAYAGHKVVVELLLERSVDVNQKGPYGELALHWAAAKGHHEVVVVLLDAGAEANTKTEKQRVDMDTVTREDTDVVERQLRLLALRERQRRAKVAGRGLQIAVSARLAFAAGDTALHSAAQWGHKEIVKLLLDGGAEVNAVNRWGETPLHYACVFRQKGVVEILLDGGADVNIKDKNGHTAVGLASSPRGAAANDIVKLLVTRQGDTSAKH